MVGFYRLWGDYAPSVTAFDTAYNIYQNPGNVARETVVDDMSFAAMIRDLFEETNLTNKFVDEGSRDGRYPVSKGEIVG